MDEAGTSAFIKADVAEQCVLLKFKELCSFGSGTWFDGPNALDVMENVGPWLNCQLNLQSLVLLEKKRIGAHLANLPVLDKVVSLRDVLLALEDAGEAGSSNRTSIFLDFTSNSF